MSGWTFETTEAGYRAMWLRAAVKPGADDANATAACKTIEANEARYRAVAARCGSVPWYWIGAIHYREASNSFSGVLHNGEKIIGTGRKTGLVPAGRGPFASWEDAAVDALRMKDLHTIAEWPVARMLYEAERYNGFGYSSLGVNSPYVWAGTTEEQNGLYVADHKFDRSKEDARLGVAAIIKRMAERRADVSADISGPAGMPPRPAAPSPQALPPPAAAAAKPSRQPHAPAAGAVAIGAILATFAADWRYAALAFGLGLLAAFVLYKVLKRS